MADDLDIPMPSMMPAGASWRNVRRRGGDSSTQRIALFAGVVGGGLLLLVGAWSLTGQRSSAVPVIEADSRPLRTKPENRGGLQVAGEDDAILSGTSGGQDGMAPPPETPAPQALHEAVAPVRPPPSSPTPAQPVSLAEPPAAPHAAAVSAAPEKPEPAQAVPLPAPVLQKAAGATQVQLAALTTEEAARAEWQRLLHKMPDLLGGRSPSIARMERADGKVFWRLRTSGFPDIAEATAFCAKVRAKGGGCSIGGF